MHPVESKAWFLLDLCPLPLEFPPDLPAFLLLCTSKFSPQESSVAAIHSWKKERVNSPVQRCSLLAALMWYLWMCGLMDWWRNVMRNSWILPTWLFVETVVMVSPPFQAASFWRIHKNSVCLFNFFGQHGPKIMEGKKYTNTKKKKKKIQPQATTNLFYSNTKKCRKLLFCLFIWKCLPFLRMLISKLI